jgi:hypothetical protein
VGLDSGLGLGIGSIGIDTDVFCRLTAESNLDAIDGVNGWVTYRSSVQHFYLRIGNEAHVHEVILDAGREIQ